MAMPLEGIRILDLTVWGFGPISTQTLADFGAEVIKVEDPVAGDPARAITRLRLQPTPGPDINFMFEYFNRNKKSFAVDLKQEAGRALLYKLVEKADAFVTTLEPQSVERLKIDYPSISAHNPRIIYARGSAWGPRGPEAEAPGYDIVVNPRVGIQGSLGEPDMPPPTALPLNGDNFSGLTMAYGIMLALFHRERTGEGQEINISLYGAHIGIAASELQHCLTTGQEWPRLSRKNATNPFWNSYRCGDGRWLQCAMIQTDRYWPAMCRALGLENLLDDPRFNTHWARVGNATELIAIWDKVFLTKPRDEWLRIFKGYPELIWQPVNTFLEATQDPQAHANEYIVEVDHPSVGRMKMVGPHVQLARTPGTIRTLAPQLGEHTEQILLDLLGYEWGQIMKLKEAKVII